MSCSRDTRVIKVIGGLRIRRGCLNRSRTPHGKSALDCLLAAHQTNLDRLVYSLQALDTEIIEGYFVSNKNFAGAYHEVDGCVNRLQGVFLE